MLAVYVVNVCQFQRMYIQIVLETPKYNITQNRLNLLDLLRWKRSTFSIEAALEACGVLQSVNVKCVYPMFTVVGEVHCHVCWLHVENSKVLLKQTSYPFILLALFYTFSCLAILFTSHSFFLSHTLFHSCVEGIFSSRAETHAWFCNVL